MATKKKALKRKVIVLRRRGGTVSLSDIRRKIELLNSGSLKTEYALAPAKRARILLAS